MLDFNLLDTKSYLRKIRRKLSQFSYDTSYQGGHYESVFDDNFELLLLFGSKTKTKHIASLEARDVSANEYLKKIKSPVFIKERYSEYELLNLGFENKRGWECRAGEYVIQIGGPGVLENIIIDHEPTIIQNSGILNIRKRMERFEEVENCEEIKKKLEGVWLFSEEETEKLNVINSPFLPSFDNVLEFQDNHKKVFYDCALNDQEKQNLQKALDLLNRESELNSKEKDEFQLYKSRNENLIRFISQTDCYEVFKDESDLFETEFYKVSKLFKNKSFSLKVFMDEPTRNYKFSFDGDRLIMNVAVFREKNPYQVVYLSAKKEYLM